MLGCNILTACFACGQSLAGFDDVADHDVSL